MLSWLNPFSFFSHSQRYRYIASLLGHTAAVNAISIHVNANLIVSGGDDEDVRVWDIGTFKCIQVIKDSTLVWGQITALHFLNLERCGLSNDNICFGTGAGQFLIYHRLRITEKYSQFNRLDAFEYGDCVEDFDFDHLSRKFCLASHYGKVRLFGFEHNTLMFLWSYSFYTVIPRSVQFVYKGAFIWVYLLDTGEIHTLDADTAHFKSSKRLRTPIGSVDTCSFKSNMVVDNMTTGFDVYPIGNLSAKKSFPVEGNKKFVRDVRFLESGDVIVGGSDHGKVYIFDVASGRTRQILKHGPSKQLIQVVQTGELADRRLLIVTAGSNGTFSPKVWIKERKRKVHKRSMSSLCGIIKLVLILALLWLTQAIWFPPIYVHYRFAILPRLHNVRPVIEQLVQALEYDPSFWTQATGSSTRDPSLVEFVDRIDEDTVGKVWGPDSTMSRSNLIQVARRSSQKELAVID